METFDEATVALLKEQAEALGAPGAAIVGVAPGRDARLVFGCDPSSARPVPARDGWFFAASSGKHVTAHMVLSLVDQGRLTLDDPVGAHLPDVPVEWAGRTIKSLLDHTGGLPEYLTRDSAASVPVTRAEFMARHAALAPLFDEGTSWSYSNTHYILLGFLVAAVAGKPYASALEDLLERRACAGLAVGDARWARGARDGRPETAAAREVVGDGDVCFTLDGAASWLRALLASPADGAASAPFTTRPFRSGRRPFYGNGMFIEPLGTGRFIHHAGHYEGCTAMIALNPAAGAGTAAFCPVAPGHTRAVRALALQAMEALAPGSTPRSLPPIADDDIPSTRRIIGALRRAADAWPRERFATELQIAHDIGSVRGVLDLDAGGAMASAVLVGSGMAASHRYRRYRVTYADRIEHLLVGLGADDRIHWASLV